MAKVAVTRTLDDDTLKLLRLLADDLYEGNESWALRQIIRWAADERGIKLEQGQEV